MLVFVLLRQELGVHILQSLDEIPLVLSVALVHILHDIENTIDVEPVLLDGFEEVSDAVVHFLVDVLILSLPALALWRCRGFGLSRNSW